MRRFSLWFAVFAALAACAAGAWAQIEGPGVEEDPAIVQGEEEDAEDSGFGRFPPIAHVFRVPHFGVQERRVGNFLGLDDRQRAAMHNSLEQCYRATRPIVRERNDAFWVLLRTLSPGYEQDRPTFGEVAMFINGLETKLLENELRFWTHIKNMLTQEQQRRFFLLFEARILGPV